MTRQHGTYIAHDMDGVSGTAVNEKYLGDKDIRQLSSTS